MCAQVILLRRLIKCQAIAAKKSFLVEKKTVSIQKD